LVTGKFVRTMKSGKTKNNVWFVAFLFAEIENNYGHSIASACGPAALDVINECEAGTVLEIEAKVTLKSDGSCKYSIIYIVSIAGRQTRQAALVKKFGSLSAAAREAKKRYLREVVAPALTEFDGYVMSKKRKETA